MNHWLNRRNKRNIFFTLEIIGAFSESVCEVVENPTSSALSVRSKDLPLWTWMKLNPTKKGVTTGQLNRDANFTVKIKAPDGVIHAIEPWRFLNVHVQEAALTSDNWCSLTISCSNAHKIKSQYFTI